MSLGSAAAFSRAVTVTSVAPAPSGMVTGEIRQPIAVDASSSSLRVSVAVSTARPWVLPATETLSSRSSV